MLPESFGMSGFSSASRQKQSIACTICRYLGLESQRKFYLSDSKNSAETVAEAPPTSTNPELYLPRWTIIGNRKLLQIIACILSTHPKLGNECHEFAHNVTRIEVCDRCSTNCFYIIFRSLYIGVCLDIKLLVVFIPNVGSMDMMPWFLQGWNSEGGHEMGGHEVHSMFNASKKRYVERNQRMERCINGDETIPSTDFIWNENLACGVQFLANILSRHIVHRNIITNEPSKLIKESDR